MIEGSTDFVGVVRPDGTIDYLNRAARRLVGLALDADVGHRLAAEFYTPDTVARVVEEALPAALRDGAWTGDGTVLSMSGETIPVSMSIVAYRSDDEDDDAPYFTATMRDLRERLAVEATLRAREAELRAIVDHAATGISVIAPDGTIASANLAFHTFLGYDEATLIGRYAPDFSPAEDAYVTRDAVAALRDGRASSVTVEKRFVRRDGAVRLAALTLTLIPLADGRTGVLGLTHDVTDRRAAEAALARSEARYRAAIEGSLDAFIALRAVRDATGAIVEFEVEEASTLAALLVGMPREDLVGQRLCELFPIARSEGHFERYVEVAETRVAMEGEFEPTDPRVTARVLRVQAVPLEDGVALSLRDVTAHRAAQKALRESEARLHATVEASLDALFVLRPRDVDFEVVECNGRGAALARGARAEVVGRSLDALFPAARRRGLTASCAHVAATGEPHTTEYRMDAPDAPASWTWLQIVRVGDGVAITARDITAQKQSEEALRAMALVDELTGVYNRRGFLTAAEREWNRAERDRQGALLAYIDLNDFKGINDTHGHVEGDRALRAIGEVLRAAFRGADVIGRLGGDEFAILVVPTSNAGLVGAGHASLPLATVESMIRERLAHHLDASNALARRGGRPYDLSLSVGVASAEPGDSSGGSPITLTTLMVEADERLYDEKRRRKGR